MTAEKPKLIIRMADLDDAGKIATLSRKIYGKGEGYTVEEVRGQINNFIDGQLVAEYEGKIVGHCATFQISEKTARAAHSWAEITGGVLLPGMIPVAKFCMAWKSASTRITGDCASGCDSTKSAGSSASILG
ncbi:hypothetical protein [Parasphingorhabdus halotolerans]|uniref:hypothetical protein n=1 Tax=Parasphingorhabdus halotolerans TaxID=2725558 RepID=UPI001FEC1D96|nr:hypothetical protein [Parasphingorhabdus halotolerans]